MITTLAELNVALTNPQESRRLIDNSTDLVLAGRQFPSHLDSLIKPLLANSEEFKRLINNSTDLVIIGRQFPDHLDSLIQPLLANPEEFKRLIKTSTDLLIVGKQFINQSLVFKQPDIQKALEALIHMQTAKAYTKGAAIGALSDGNNSKVLPPEISAHIASFFNRKDGAQLAQTSKAAAETAKNEEEHQKSLSKK